MRKVMVLEDESSIRSFIVINLQPCRATTSLRPETGEEALDKLKENPRYPGGAAGHHAAGDRRL
ncbi:MAG: hypothetical protein ACLR0P_13145 [Oscillospiraceae bacterium]